MAVMTPQQNAGSKEDEIFRERQLAMFRASVLKQAKWRALSQAVGDGPIGDAADLGSDNGVISYLFRERGGNWRSADLTDETVHAIRRMVGDEVYRLTDAKLPFGDASLDLIVVVDLLEHLPDDAALLAEIARCLRPGGRAVLNVPNRKRLAVLPPIRHAIGLTDAWHGHVHAGYRSEDLRGMLPPALRFVHARTYSRFFSHLLDTALNAAFLRTAGERAVSTAKGMVVTGADLGAGGAGAMRKLYPALRAFAGLDALLPWSEGYMLLATLERVADGESPPRSSES